MNEHHEDHDRGHKIHGAILHDDNPPFCADPPSTERAPRPPQPPHVMQFFAYDHLPQWLQVISRPFCELARFVATQHANPQRAVALQHLLDAKDAAVRSAMSVRT